MGWGVAMLRGGGVCSVLSIYFHPFESGPAQVMSLLKGGFFAIISLLDICSRVMLWISGKYEVIVSIVINLLLIGVGVTKISNKQPREKNT